MAIDLEIPALIQRVIHGSGHRSNRRQGDGQTHGGKRKGRLHRRLITTLLNGGPYDGLRHLSHCSVRHRLGFLIEVAMKATPADAPFISAAIDQAEKALKAWREAKERERQAMLHLMDCRRVIDFYHTKFIKENNDV